ncbi:MAG: hypothetical protein QOH79_3549 [Acidimicrobiaceae bacterium]
MIKLDGATVLLQWATGGLFFLWITSRKRVVSAGYGWLLRSIYLVLAGAAAAIGVRVDALPVRDVSAALVAAAAAVALTLSIVRRRAGVATFPAHLDLVAPIFGVIGLIAAGVHAGDPALLSVVRTVVGAAFLGSVSDAMLLGHWYLVQPGLARGPLLEMVRWVGIVWPLEVASLLWPTGMLSVLDGSIDDGYAGLLGWFWIACAITTIVLVVVTRAALKERAYSAVMAATGLLYLAILTAFGTDLVARAVLAR